MLSINGKKFMNLPEAVQWLLNNNALPFQCKANYVANTIIAKSDIINPSPAEIKVGSLVLFADSKVGTVSGVTDAGFMVGQDYTDIGAQLNQITGIALNASGHLIITLANGDTIDAGLVKQLSGFTIDASQHLIAHYNDGTSTDLGPIFQGNVNIAGNLTADSIIENMAGYSFTKAVDTANATLEMIYAGAVKTGNKITLVMFCKLTKLTATDERMGSVFTIPSSVGENLFPYPIGGNDYLDNGEVESTVVSTGVHKTLGFYIAKYSNSQLAFVIGTTGLDVNDEVYVRIEKTFLLSQNLAS